MVSHRNYLAMTAGDDSGAFLFQFTNIALESWNDYERAIHMLWIGNSFLQKAERMEEGMEKK